MDFLNNAYKYKHDWWRYALTIILSVLSTFVVPAVLAILYIIVCGVAGNVDVATETIKKVENEELVAWQGAIIMLIWHCFFLCSLLFFFVKIHKGRIISLISSFSKIRWKRIFIGIILYLMVYPLFMLSTPDGSIEYVFDAKEFVPYLVVLLLMLPIQVAAEEIFNRSYLGQMFALVCRFPIVTVLLTACIFTPLHYGDMQNTESYGVLFSSIFITGTVFAIIMILDDGIELCIGIHFINNLLYFSIYKDDGLSGIFQFVEGFKIGYSEIILDVLAYSLVLLICTKKYHWDWSRLFRKIERPEVAEQKA